MPCGTWCVWVASWSFTLRFARDLSSRFGRSRGCLTFRSFRWLILRREHFTLEDPNLDADDAIVGARLGQAVVDVRAQRVQRNAAFAVLLSACDFRAVQAAGN